MFTLIYKGSQSPASPPLILLVLLLSSSHPARPAPLAPYTLLAPPSFPAGQREDAAVWSTRRRRDSESPIHNVSFPPLLPGSPAAPPDIPVAQREDAVASLEYEAQARLRDPVYGCVGVICLLQKEMVALQEQLRDIEASSLSSSPNATHGSKISGDGAMYGGDSVAAAVPSAGAAGEEGDEC
ncbi:unnamed protein product [Closterium sp. Naga37s-1]|nr:unnamed protein product [Closterium sp. Naga37s-1]